MQTNLINSYMQNKNTIKPNTGKKASEEIELITIRKAKPNFDINRELANRTFIRPLPPKAHLVHDSIMAAPAIFVKDMAYDLKALKSAWKGDANDHQLGKLNDLGLKLGGLGIATYLFSIKKAPVAKGMEFVGLASFLASMSLWPKLFLEMPARVIHGFNPFMRYEDSQGRKKPFFQDNQYLPFDLITDKEINRIGNRLGIPKDLPNRRDAVQEKMRQIALQNNTMWMLTAGFATPIMSSFICSALEPAVSKVHSYFVNRKLDNILVDFASAQQKYKNNDIETAVDSIIQMYKGRPIDDKVINSLTKALTKRLNPLVELGVKADLEGMLKQDAYKVSQLQFNPLVSSMKKAVSKAIGNGPLQEYTNTITPTVDQIVSLFASNKLLNSDLSTIDLKDLSNTIMNQVKANIAEINKEDVIIPKNVEVRIFKSLLGQDILSGPIMKVLSNRPSVVFDDNIQNKLKQVASKMSAFCAENDALQAYSFEKLASAPDTLKAKVWNKVASSLIDVLKITPQEIVDTRYDRPLVAELIRKKMANLAANSDTYKQAISEIAEKLKEFDGYVNAVDFDGKFVTQVDASYNSFANSLRQLGFNRTAARIVGENGVDAGSLIRATKSFVNDNLSNIKNTFSRVINAMNFYRTLHTDPNLSLANNVYSMEGGIQYRLPDAIPKEVKEEIVAFAEYLVTSGRISDYSVKFEFLRNLKPNKEDFGPIEFNENGEVKFKYYNAEKMSKKGVFIPSDANFFKRNMSFIFGGDIHPDTAAALTQEKDILNQLNEYRSNMLRKVGNIENFAAPSLVAVDDWYRDAQGRTYGRKYTDATINERSLFVGSSFDELIHNASKTRYNTKQWMKMFGGIGIGVAAFTVLSQFFFGRSGRSVKKDKV